MMGVRPTFEQLTRSQVRWLVRGLALDAIDSSDSRAQRWGSSAWDRARSDTLIQDDISYARDHFNSGPFTPPAIEEVANG